MIFNHFPNWSGQVSRPLVYIVKYRADWTSRRPNRKSTAPTIGKPGPSGIGGVLRNHDGILLGIFSLSVGILDSNVAELRAVVKAIELSASNCFLHHKHIIIESDSANVISWMNNPHNRPWIHHKLFSSTQRLASCFDSISYTHSYRESNHMADHLAKQGVHRISDFVAWL